MTKKPIKYWQWFFQGSGANPGYRRIVDKWILCHCLIGIILSFIVQADLVACANTVLLPLVGILIGLSFAWAGNAQALMQSNEIGLLSEYHEGGFVEYVYLYQTAILIILFTVVCWGLAGLEIFDKQWPTTNNRKSYFIVKGFLFMFSSLTLRSCWQVIMGTQWMLLVQKRIKENVLGKDKNHLNN